MQLNGVLEETSWEESSASVAAMYPIDDFSYIIFLFYFPHPTRGPWCRFPPLVDGFLLVSLTSPLFQSLWPQKRA